MALTVLLDGVDLGHGGRGVGPEDGLAVLPAGGVAAGVAAARRAHCRGQQSEEDAHSAQTVLAVLSLRTLVTSLPVCVCACVFPQCCTLWLLHEQECNPESKTNKHTVSLPICLCVCVCARSLVQFIYSLSVRADKVCVCESGLPR